MSANHIGDYVLTTLIGRGATGRVWRGVHSVTGAEVAVKVLRSEYADDPAVRERFLAEARLLIGHTMPGVVRVYQSIDDDETPAIVMELVTGPTLRDLVSTGQVPSERAARLSRHIAEALAAAHAVGLVHGDVKPENVLIRDEGSPDEATVLSDFGLARVLEESSATQTRSQVIGTPHYAAPEIHSGGKCRAPADVYSLGVILYELIAGRRPFQAQHTSGIIEKHLNEPPAPTSDFSQPLWEAVAACLAKDPNDRPTAKSLSQRLQGVLDECRFQPEVLATTAWATKNRDTETPSTSGRRRLRTVAGMVSLALLAGGGAVTYFRLSGPDSQREDHIANARAEVSSSSTSPTRSPSPATSSTAPATTAAATQAPRTDMVPPAIPPPVISGDADSDDAAEPPAGSEANPPPANTGGGSGTQRKAQTTPDPIPPQPPPPAPQGRATTAPPLGPQRSTRTAKLSDGRVLEVQLYWNRTATHNDWTKVRYRVTGGGSRPYAVNFSIYASGKRMYFAGFAAVPGDSWYSLSLQGNATRRELKESLLVQVYPANRQPPTRIGETSFIY